MTVITYSRTDEQGSTETVTYEVVGEGLAVELREIYRLDGKVLDHQIRYGNEHEIAERLHRSEVEARADGWGVTE